MNNKKEKKIKIEKEESNEEFIPSLFKWLSLENQKKNTERFEEISRNKKC